MRNDEEELLLEGDEEEVLGTTTRLGAAGNDGV
jgi:hypothetical protein